MVFFGNKNKRVGGWLMKKRKGIRVCVRLFQYIKG